MVAPQTNILNSIISRMSQRNRTYAIMVAGNGLVPRPKTSWASSTRRKSPKP